MKKIILILMTLNFLCGCKFNSHTQENFLVAVENNDSETKAKRLSSEELYKAVKDSIKFLYQKAANSINYETGELKISENELTWSSEKYKDLFWYHKDFKLKVQKKKIGNDLYYFTNCFNEGVNINIFGFLQLDRQASIYVLKDSSYNIIREEYYNNPWTLDYSLAYTQDSLPIAVFRVGQGEETVYYSETIALFDIKKRKLIGDEIPTMEMYDGEGENYNWKSETHFSDSIFINGYPCFMIKTQGTSLANDKKIDFNKEITYKYNSEKGKYE